MSPHAKNVALDPSHIQFEQFALLPTVLHITMTKWPSLPPVKKIKSKKKLIVLLGLFYDNIENLFGES